MSEKTSIERFLLETYGVMLTIDELAQVLKNKKATLYKWINTKEIPIKPIRVRNGLRWNTSEVARYVESLSDGITAKKKGRPRKAA